jgi:NADH-quinone oxidoreductase subunit E
MLTDEIRNEIATHIHEPEHKQSACTEALRIVQKHRGWIDDQSIRDIAEYLEMTPDELDGVATFFNLIHRRPVGKYVIRICSSVSCWVLGYDALRDALLTRLGVNLGETTADGRFTVIPNQCLGTCDRAPAFMINGDLFQNVEVSRIDEILQRYP